ncbi:phospholipid scramblase family protein [Marinomonas sp. C2222]|uniref:Phospholipid scramblase family protein n=1 Tax=Marinomonas sargassi TaxID=2984494 RepID=A0ABT2YRY9_9GAMM|nr:phospholipid scramblase family protein [Marinomonas sargassi]MCV2402660.1 phospholipid scramblase family protein [Marinomonas sargassi]
MEKLDNLDILIVNQKMELGEVVTGFETRNQYLVRDSEGNRLYHAVEEKGSVLLRLFLKNSRPFNMLLLSDKNEVALSIKRKFRFIFHEAEINDANGRRLGHIQKRFTFFRSEYTVFDRYGNEIYQLSGPVFKPWTFFIKNNEKEYGKITKEWSGLLKESFSDADNFGVVFPLDFDTKSKALFLGAVFLIDFVHFENSKSKPAISIKMR